MQPEPFRKGTSSNRSIQSMNLESRFHQDFLYTSTSDPKIYMEKQSNQNTQNNFGKDPFWRTHINLISNLCTNTVIKTVQYWQNGQTFVRGQWNRRVQKYIHTSYYDHCFSAEVRSFPWDEDSLFDKCYRSNQMPRCKNMNLDPHLTPYTKFNSKGIITLNSKTIKLLEENRGEKPCDLELGDDFLDTSLKA